MAFANAYLDISFIMILVLPHAQQDSIKILPTEFVLLVQSIAQLVQVLTLVKLVKQIILKMDLTGVFVLQDSLLKLQEIIHV
jgi:hypothetical protein